MIKLGFLSCLNVGILLGVLCIRILELPFLGTQLPLHYPVVDEQQQLSVADIFISVLKQDHLDV